MADKQFVVSVADALLIDDNTDQVVVESKTLLSSAMTQSVQNTEIRGGYGNKLLYDWSYQKDLQFTLEDAAWREEYIALNNGVGILSGLSQFYKNNEPVVLAGGTGSVAETPIGNVYVKKPDGKFVTITPSGKNITVPGLTNETVFVTYRYETNINKIVISADNYPTSYRLVLKTQIVAQTGKIADVEIVVPRFKISGNMEINFGAAEAATSSMDGRALAWTDPDTGEDVYAYVNIKPTTTSSITFVGIAVSPSDITLSSGESEQLTVYGIQGGLLNNIVNPTGTIFTSNDPAVATVDANGLVEYAGVGETFITVTNQGITDVVRVTCV